MTYVAKVVTLRSIFSASNGIVYAVNFVINIDNLKTQNQLIPIIAPLQLTFSMRNFNVQALLNFLASQSAEAMKSVDFVIMEKLLTQTVRSDSTFDLNIAATTPSGKLMSHSKSILNAGAELPATFDDIITNSYTKATVRVSSTLVPKIIELNRQKLNVAVEQHTQILSTKLSKTKTNYTVVNVLPPKTPEQLINDLLKNGYMNKDGDDYTSVLSIENGVWKLNGWVVSSQYIPIQTKLMALMGF
jgi:hypothetical protein